MGTTAYEYAVQAGFEGTEEEFAQAVLPEDVSWAQITEKPETYQPAAHQHDWADVTGTPATFPPATHSHAWADITGKPTTFPPAAHNHDSAYEPQSGEWIVLADPANPAALTSPWTPFASPGGHYFQGIRYRVAATDVIVQAMLSTPGAVGSTIAALPEGHGIEYTTIQDAETNAGPAKVRVALSGSAGAKTAQILYYSGPASATWLHFNLVIPRG